MQIITLTNLGLHNHNKKLKIIKMKLLKNILFALLILSAVLLVDACRKPYTYIAANDTDIINNSATVQIFGACARIARNYAFVDGAPVSGATFSFGGVFPGTAYSFRVTPGTHSLLMKDTLVTTTQVLTTYSQVFDLGKNYTIFLYDTVTSPKVFAVQNKITIPTDTSCMLRFANFIYNPTAVPNVDVYSFRRGGIGGFATTTTPIFANVATNQVTDFIPYASLLPDTLYVYGVGTTAPLLAKQLVVSLTPTRSYTSAYIGSHRAAATAKSISTFATY